MQYYVGIALFTLLFFGSAPEALTATAEIKEWPVPWNNTRPRDPYAASTDKVWFVGQRGDYAAYLNPKTGEFKRFDLESGAGPHNLIVADGGTVWYAGNRAAHIGKLDPERGDIVKFPMPDPAARDPHTLVFDPAGDIWFTVQGGNFVGKLDTDNGAVKLLPVPTPNARPYGIAMAEDGRPWFTEFGSNKLATVDPKTLQLKEIELPRQGARPRRIGITSDGAVWYVDYAQGFLGRLDPANGAIQEWPAPAGVNSRPYAMAVDNKDRLWFVETGPSPNRFVGFDPKSETFFSVTDIPSGGGSVRHMDFHEATGTVWFGTDTNTIGRVVLP